mgnify:CR=1 FL=1
MPAFNVYLGTRLIDTVYHNEGATVDEVRRGLIHHDGYDADIRVVQQGIRYPSGSTRVQRFLKEIAQERAHGSAAKLVIADDILETRGEGAVMRYFEPEIVLRETMRRAVPRRLSASWGSVSTHEISVAAATKLVRSCTGDVSRRAPRPGYETSFHCDGGATGPGEFVPHFVTLRRHGNICEIDVRPPIETLKKFGRGKHR